jgi:hypothetical protein
MREPSALRIAVDLRRDPASHHETPTIDACVCFHDFDSTAQ